MPDYSLQINVGADVGAAVTNINNFEDSLAGLQAQIKQLNAQRLTLSDPAQIALVNQQLATTAAGIERIRNIGKVGFDEFGEAIVQIPPKVNSIIPSLDNFGTSLSKQKLAFVDFGRIITGQGFSLRSLASNFALLGPEIAIAGAAIYGLVELFGKQSDAEKKAEEDAKQLKQTLLDLKSVGTINATATGSEAGNIDRVRDLAAIVNDSTRSYADQKRALDALKATNKDYFGDLTKGTATVAEITKRTNEYAEALITEAKVKGQVSSIATVSEEYEKQVLVLNKLKSARDSAQERVNQTGPVAVNQFGGMASADAFNAANNLSSVTKQLTAQQVVVDKLSTQLGTYKGALQQALSLQVTEEPLKTPKIGKPIDELQKEIEGYQKIIEALNKIKSISGDKLFGFNNQQLFNTAQFGLLTDQIKQAGIKGIKDGLSPQVIAAQIQALQAELAKTGLSRNQDIGKVEKSLIPARLKFEDTASSETIDQAQAAIEKQFIGKDIQVKIPLDIKLGIENSNYTKAQQEILLKNLEQQAVQNLPIIRWNPKIQAIIDRKEIEDALGKQLTQSLNNAFKNSLASGLEGIGQSIGTAIAKGTNPIEAAGKSLLTSLGDLIEQLGKSLIEYGIAKEGLDTVLEAGITLPGIAAIAIGVGAELLGSLVKSAGNSYKAMATGGIVTGPTNALIGEAGPEVVFPLERLNSFVKGVSGGAGNITVVGTNTIKGTDLITTFNRATTANNQRNYNR